MEKVTIYKFEMYNIESDEWQESRRWAVSEKINEIGARKKGNGVVVDTTVIQSNIQGFTERGFDPDAQTGFPKYVK